MRFSGFRRPSPALIIACAALFVALGGTSYAVINLPANSVGTRQLKPDAVTGAKVRRNAITGADVSEATLGKVPSANTLDGLDSTQFSRSEGLILLSSPWTNWVTSNETTITRTYLSDLVRFGSTNPGGFAGGEFFHLAPDVPVALFGKRLRLLGAELCAEGGDGSVFLRVYSHVADPGGGITNSVSSTNLHGCNVYGLPNPVPLGENQSVGLTIMPAAGVTRLDVGRTTFIFDGTQVNATAPS
jgi:hypothetical protein